MTLRILQNVRGGPDRDASLTRYRALARDYDDACRGIAGIRQAGIDALQLRKGETVLDVACGTGWTLPILADRVGPQGRVIGVEQCPEMAARAQSRVVDANVQGRVSLLVAPIEEAKLSVAADAVLLCYTHDVLQSEQALGSLMRHMEPHARVVVVGLKFLPWWWGAPLNVYSALRCRDYLTTYRGMREPWKPLLPWCPDLRVRRTFHAGTSYLAAGTVGSHALKADAH
jgi:SAM-dependent methyltransferase